MTYTRIRDLREDHDLTQKEVAEMAGLSVLSVYRFENGTVTNISLSTFLLLMKATNTGNHEDWESRKGTKNISSLYEQPFLKGFSKY